MLQRVMKEREAVLNPYEPSQSPLAGGGSGRPRWYKHWTAGVAAGLAFYCFALVAVDDPFFCTPEPARYLAYMIAYPFEYIVVFCLPVGVCPKRASDLLVFDWFHYLTSTLIWASVGAILFRVLFKSDDYQPGAMPTRDSG
ncbi:hypothetical protein KOR34_48900 [Posidoniimonas corsicana]|uniref:Uncharacterized protein n=1 Tax=Posidoniimonas corsicana TaxID=1938618 RepID=A0A5C5UXY1_9BACT|nr:hypothetical protein KOR34_48900 [Posidoniimonas corsicana]